MNSVDMNRKDIVNNVEVFSVSVVMNIGMNRFHVNNCRDATLIPMNSVGSVTPPNFPRVNLNI
jgi:hypothetical protein